MDDLGVFTIEIPCDEDGFALFQCPLCGDFFKLRPDDYESDEVVEVCCPACGIASDSYMTEDVREHLQAVSNNIVMEALYKEMKKIERQTKGNAVSLKAGKQPKPDFEPTLRPSNDSLALVSCRHCGMQSKVSHLLAMSAFVCPFCGVTNFNDR